MDIIIHEAITELTSAVSALLPPPQSPTLPPVVAVLPERVTPTGIGGYVGPNREPFGDVLGRRLQARVLLTVRASSLAALGGAVQEANRALLGAGSTALRSRGILRLDVGGLGPATVSGAGPSQVAQRDVEVSVLFEHLRLPVEAGSVIGSVPLLVETASSGRGGRVLASGRFHAGSLAAFEVFDDPAATQGGPSEWVFDDAERRIEQRSNIRGGSFEATPNKPGTYLVLRDSPTVPPLTDFVLSTEMGSDDVDAIGLVFRWRDVDNFYLLALDARRGYRMIVRKVAGVFEALDPPALVETPGFTPGEIRSVRLAVQGDAFRVHLDGQPALAGRDSALPAAGRVGFGCRANEAAHFYRLDLTEL